MKRGSTATVGGPEGRRVRAQFLKHPPLAKKADTGDLCRVPARVNECFKAEGRTERLWIGDNGRVTCSGLRCAGMTAHYAGMKHDLSGGPMELIDLAAFKMLVAVGCTPKCEGCGAEASVLA